MTRDPLAELPTEAADRERREMAAEIERLRKRVADLLETQSTMIGPQSFADLQRQAGDQSREIARLRHLHAQVHQDATAREGEIERLREEKARALVLVEGIRIPHSRPCDEGRWHADSDCVCGAKEARELRDTALAALHGDATTGKDGTP